VFAAAVSTSGLEEAAVADTWCMGHENNSAWYRHNAKKEWASGSAALEGRFWEVTFCSWCCMKKKPVLADEISQT